MKRMSGFLDKRIDGKNCKSLKDKDALEERRLLRSLDEAIRDIDAGKGMSLEDVRKRVASWAGK